MTGGNCLFPVADRDGGFRGALVYGCWAVVELFLLSGALRRLLERGGLCGYHGPG